MSLVLGLEIEQGNDGKKYVIMTAMHEAGQHRMIIADNETYMQNLDIIVQGLLDIKAEMRKTNSGLVLAKKELANGFLRPPQGGTQQRKSPAGTTRPRTSKG